MTELEQAADAFKEAPKRLQAAIVRAAEGGETALEIAKAIDFAYSPDYVSRIIRKELGPRPRGPRPAV